MKRLFALFLLTASAPAFAAEFSCPDLSQAVQVGDCADEKSLNYTYAGYCSDDKRMYDKDGGDTCVTLEDYKKLKHTALWEAGDFQGYQHCSAPAAQIKTAKPVGLKIGAAGPITRISCSYDGAADMVMRLRKQCRVQDDKAVCDE